jgi:formate hydrogenlyase subunit 3/multisubunit Na+/H+ antiporter MnhD subunit
MNYLDMVVWAITIITAIVGTLIVLKQKSHKHSS